MICDRATYPIHAIQVGIRQPDVRRSGVLNGLFGMAGTDDGAYARLVDDPGQGQLSQGNVFFSRQGAQLLQGGLDPLIMRGCEQFIGRAVIPFGELVVRAEFAGKQPLGHGRIGQDGDVVVPAIGQFLLLGLPPEKGVRRLQALNPAMGQARLQ